jgi:hypothetical protein
MAELMWGKMPFQAIKSCQGWVDKVNKSKLMNGVIVAAPANGYISSSGKPQFDGATVRLEFTNYCFIDGILLGQIKPEKLENIITWKPFDDSSDLKNWLNGIIAITTTGNKQLDWLAKNFSNKIFVGDLTIDINGKHWIEPVDEKVEDLLTIYENDEIDEDDTKTLEKYLLPESCDENLLPILVKSKKVKTITFDSYKEIRAKLDIKADAGSNKSGSGYSKGIVNNYYFESSFDKFANLLKILGLPPETSLKDLMKVPKNELEFATSFGGITLPSSFLFKQKVDEIKEEKKVDLEKLTVELKEVEETSIEEELTNNYIEETIQIIEEKVNAKKLTEDWKETVRSYDEGWASVARLIVLNLDLSNSNVIKQINLLMKDDKKSSFILYTAGQLTRIAESFELI